MMSASVPASESGRSMSIDDCRPSVAPDRLSDSAREKRTPNCESPGLTFSATSRRPIAASWRA